MSTITDPLKAMPDLYDQIVYFASVHLIDYVLFFGLLCLGIWNVYYGSVWKESRSKTGGWLCVALAAIWLCVFRYFGDIRYYLTETASHNLNSLQKLELDVAVVLCNVFGPPDGVGSWILMAIIVIACIAILVTLITKIRKTRKLVKQIKAKAEKEEREDRQKKEAKRLKKMERRIKELENELKEKS